MKFYTAPVVILMGARPGARGRLVRGDGESSRARPRGSSVSGPAPWSIRPSGTPGHEPTLVSPPRRCWVGLWAHQLGCAG